MISDTIEADQGDVERRGWVVVGALIVSYIGIYLCRKNFSVAVPLLQQSFGATKAEVGTIATVGTIAYALGKVVNGPIVDRIGGRWGLLLALVAVGCFGAASAFAPGLFVLTLLVAGNRFAGSAGWGAMLKLIPTWFDRARTGTAVGVLSVSYLVGGILATLLAGRIVGAGGGWRAVLGFPSLVLAAVLVLCFVMVRSGPRKVLTPSADSAQKPKVNQLEAVLELLANPQFIIICALSFTLTLMRESFNTWSVDFLTSIQSSASLEMMAFRSIGFDMAGIPPILLAGFAYDRIQPRHRRWWMAGSLALLATALGVLYRIAVVNPVYGAGLMAVVGLLIYGPYSLLAGAFAVEVGGARLAATASGLIDGVGYLGGALAGFALGRVLDIGGYGLGFKVLALVTMVAAGLALALKPAARA